MVEITNFETLLEAAKAEPQPQEFLFVFLNAYLSEDATPDQVKRFKAGQGGLLRPIMQVHKPLTEIMSFDALKEEAKSFSEAWKMVLIGCLAGRNGARPLQEDIDTHLENMVEAVNGSQDLSRYLAFSHEGDPIIW